jgi:hypothetical protein
LILAFLYYLASMLRRYKVNVFVMIKVVLFMLLSCLICFDCFVTTLIPNNEPRTTNHEPRNPIWSKYLKIYAEGYFLNQLLTLSCITPQKASLMMPLLIFEVPLVRSVKIIGTSSTTKPHLSAVNFISI